MGEVFTLTPCPSPSRERGIIRIKALFKLEKEFTTYSDTIKAR
jgi:hypothetical protein